jgi:uncharacterized membrane-anchored protein
MMEKDKVKSLLVKVPEITVFFWIIKVLCTTVGETAADFLNQTMGLGLTGTTVIMGTLLAVALFLQFRTRKYVPVAYWVAVVLISIFGTLITDNLSDNLNVPLIVSTVAFSAILALVFYLWHRAEGTLAIHTIDRFRREGFYWLAILFTFALGTAAGDLTAEKLSLGYLVSVGLFAASIAAIAFARVKFRVDAVLSFWIAYILTRPLGASIGDWLSQPRNAGGLELGTVVTSGLFLAVIFATVAYLTRTKRDVVARDEGALA